MKKTFVAFLAALYSTMALAQEGSGGGAIDVNVNKTDSSWYTSPWVWIIVALIFILLLVALTRGRRD